MGGKHMLKKCGTRVDRISQLPDDIIVHILSFLPLKKAAATSILSPRWLHLWKYTPKLNFVDQRATWTERRAPWYVNWVNSVIESHKALTLQEFSIDFHPDKSAQCHIAKWLEFSFSRQVERLDLTWDKMTHNSPVLEEILKEANLQTKDFKSLKVLCLGGFGTTGDAIELFVRNCPLLERLVVQGAYMTSDLEVVSDSLRHLDICLRGSRNTVKVSAPNLTWLTVDHHSGMVSLENVPKLVNMNFSCRFDDTLHDFANVAAKLETLIIMLYNAKASFSIPEMPKLKKLVLYYRYDFQCILLPVTRLIWASPCLEELKLEISEFPIQEGIFEVPKVRPTFQHQHLKRFVLSGYCGGFCDRIELVRYVVDNCVGLEEIVVGECDRIELVKDMVDYCVPLEKIFFRQYYPHEDYVPSAEERHAFERTMRLQQLPSHIKLRIVYDASNGELTI